MNRIRLLVARLMCRPMATALSPRQTVIRPLHRYPVLCSRDLQERA